MNHEKTTKNTIVTAHMGSITTPEVDFEMYHDILGKEDVDEAYEDWGVMEISDANGYYNRPMKIDDAIKILNDLKESGANYVSIEHNCDHPDYTFEGLNVRRATESDIKADKDKETLEAINKANALRNQAQKLIEEANKING